jgi:hypothetical protein
VDDVAAAGGFAYIYMKNVAAACIRKQGDAVIAAAAYCRPPMFLKHFPASFILTQGDEMIVAAAGGFAYIYMEFAGRES